MPVLSSYFSRFFGHVQISVHCVIMSRQIFRIDEMCECMNDWKKENRVDLSDLIKEN